MDEQRLILVVEDDEATRALLAENLAADGFRTATATSAGEGTAGDRDAPADARHGP